jgi:hypothetical protein
MPVTEHNGGPRFAIEQLDRDGAWRRMEGAYRMPLAFPEDRAAAMVALLNRLTIFGGPKIQYRIVEIAPAAHIVSLTS